MLESADQFRDAMRSFGLEPPQVIEPGKLYRYPGIGKRNGNTAAWCKLFADGMGGVFGDWSSDLNESWQAKRAKPFTEAEREAFRKQCDRERRERQAERDRQLAEARERAEQIWREAKPEIGEHRYLRDKGIKAHKIGTDGQQLVVPMRDTDGQLHNLQRIPPDGRNKRFLSGGRVGGLYHAIGKLNGMLCICEGYADGASIYEGTGHAVAVAFTAGNLEAVARAMRAKFPNIRLILCADDDVNMKGNPGLTKATTAALAAGGLLAVPDFGDNRPVGATDFNDLVQHSGLEALQRSIANAKPPPRERHKPQLDNAAAGDTGDRICYRRASDIKARPIHWLWQGRIARGKVTLLAGNPGLGKSQITSSVAAIVSTGGTWPVDRTSCERGTVVILSAEDDPEDTIKPRLEAAGADLLRIYILDGTVKHADGSGRAISLQQDLDRLSATLAEIGNVALVVIDPITAYLGDADSHKNAEIRALLAPLSDLAAKHGAAITCVSHLNKNGGTEAMLRVTGSLAFVAASRAAFLVAKDKDNDARRLFLPMKNNIGNDQTGLAFELRPAQVDSAAGLIETCHVVWHAGPVTITADEIMSPQANAEEGGALEDAKGFLLALLEAAPESVKRIRREANEAGHAWGTIKRAKSALGIKATKAGMKDGWVWGLPPKWIKSPEGSQAKSMSPFDKIEPLRKTISVDDAEIEAEV